MSTELVEFLADRDEPCPSCGYNLRGLTEAGCPECGERITIASLRAPPMRSPGELLSLTVAWLLGPIYAIGACLGFFMFGIGFFTHSPYVLPMGIVFCLLLGVPAAVLLTVALNGLRGRAGGISRLWVVVAAVVPPIALVVALRFL